MSRKFRAQYNPRTRVVEYTTWNLHPGEQVVIPGDLIAERRIGAVLVFDEYNVQIVGLQARTGAVVCDVLDAVAGVF